MKDAQDGDCFVLVFEQNYVGESVNHRGTKLHMDATKGIGSIGDRFNATTNRSPKMIAEVNGDLVVVRDRSSKVVRNERVVTP